MDNNAQSEERKDLQPEGKQPAGKKGKVLKEIKEWLVALAVAVVIVLIIQTFLFRIIRVDGQSMETTLHNGERLFVTVTDVKFGKVPRGIVVICHYPNRGLTYFVKRVVAIPGDTVYCENGVTHVVYEEDGETVDTALDERFGLYYTYGAPYDYEPYVLGEDEYFVVGDNRYNSHDSRDWDANGEGHEGGNDGSPTNNVGPISKKMILGRVREVIFPFGSIRPVE